MTNSQFDLVPVVTTVSAEAVDPVALLMAVSSPGESRFIVELTGVETAGRPIAVVGTNPVAIASGPAYRSGCPADDLGAANSLLGDFTVAPLPDSIGANLPFSGGLFGFLTYEACIPPQLAKPAITSMSDVPTWWFGRFETTFVLDSSVGVVHIVTYAHRGDDHVQIRYRHEQLLHDIGEIQPDTLRFDAPPIVHGDSSNWTPDESDWLAALHRS